MKRVGLWTALAAVIAMGTGCDPKPSKPTAPPKPIAQALGNDVNLAVRLPI